jgi:AmiR/NasT family two-component response regulator|tara:strand:+ start:30 stop:674 length:645 start_codon:yes stop_codon:yes gene_type:complete
MKPIDHKKKKKKNSKSPMIINDLRSLTVLIVYPKSTEGEELWEHLTRIGCQIQTCWPPPIEIPKNIDVVFLFVRPIVEGEYTFNWNTEKPPAVLIGIVDYENPSMLEKILSLQAQAVIGLPLKPFGILANIMLSVTNHRREIKISDRLARVNSKMKAYRDIDKAKLFLMNSRDITEDSAYEFIREQAMNKRTTIEAMALAIINASELLNTTYGH